MSNQNNQAEKIYENPDRLVFIQSRVATDYKLVAEYAAMMQAGIEFDAAQGIRAEDDQVFIWDGLHRGEAARSTGKLLLVEAQPGTKLQAEWLALSANQKHGLQRSREDKQRVVRNALLHSYGATKSDREIARHCGVDHKTVAAVRQELELSGEIPQITARTVNRSGATYRQNTRNIGRKPVADDDQLGEAEQAALRNSLVSSYNAAKWQQRRAAGMSDQQLRDVISQAWGRGGSSYPRQGEGIPCEVVGLKNPRIWFGDEVGKIKSAQGRPLQGQKLLQAVREALDIPPAPEARYCDFVGQEQTTGIVGDDDNEGLPDSGGKAIAPSTSINGRLSVSVGLSAGKSQPAAQEFECPKCGQDRVVGVNGSRRWCLNCNAEWPTAAAFLAAVTPAATDGKAGQVRRRLEQRFSGLLAHLAAAQLDEVEAWLEELATQFCPEHFGLD